MVEPKTKLLQPSAKTFLNAPGLPPPGWECQWVLLQCMPEIYWRSTLSKSVLELWVLNYTWGHGFEA